MATTSVDSYYARETFAGASAVSGTAPTLLTDGQLVEDLAAITVILSAPEGQTLSGAGTLDCYVFFPNVGTWGRYPGGDFTAPTAGVTNFTYDPVDIIGRIKGLRVKWIPTAVSYSGGGTPGVTVHQQGTPAAPADRKNY